MALRFQCLHQGPDMIIQLLINLVVGILLLPSFGLMIQACRNTRQDVFAGTMLVITSSEWRSSVACGALDAQHHTTLHAVG